VSPPKPERGLVTLVLPAKDEEAAIGPTLRSLPVETIRTAGFDTEILILDGQSKDRTREVAYRHGGATVVFDRRAGKGSAFKDARPYFRGDYIIMLDGDGTYAADAIPRVLGPLARDEADVVMGRREVQPGAMSGLHRFGNEALSLLARILYKRECPDTCTGMWGFRRTALQALPLTSQGFELEAELFALSSRLGLRIAHVDVDYLPRTGASKITAGDGLWIAWWLLKTRFAPLHHTAGKGGGFGATLATATHK
jgi:dolichol-phosphate hexosyltransferase